MSTAGDGIGRPAITALRRRKATRWLGGVCAVGLLATGVAGPAMAAPAIHGAKRTPAVGTEPFFTDVYQIGGNGNLIHVDPRTASDSTALFNLAGMPLGETWGQFRVATASSGAKIVRTLSGDATDFLITLSGLFPNGVYSLFYRTFGPDSHPPVCADEPSTALTARYPRRQKPDASSFVADSSGKASFHARVAGRLLDAQSVTLSVVYHFDGHVYGAVPDLGDSLGCRSSYGEDAMRQLLIVQK